MSPMAVEVVFTRDKSSSEVHKRYREGDSDRLMVDERCNLDQAGAYEILKSIEDVEPDYLCGHCWPRDRG